MYIGVKLFASSTHIRGAGDFIMYNSNIIRSYLEAHHQFEHVTQIDNIFTRWHQQNLFIA